MLPFLVFVLLLMFQLFCFVLPENQDKNILVNTRMSWNQAQLYCRQHYTDLASIPNSNVETEINNLIGGNLGQYIWTGLFADNWEWSNSSKMSSFRNWKIAPTSYGNCTAVDVNNGSLWDSLSCELKLPFICEGGKNILVNTRMSWNQAQLYCRQHYTDLASIPNSTVETEINNLIGGNLGQYIWTGLFLDSWEWSNSSKMSSFRNWKIAPTSYGNCAAVDVNNGSLWDNLSCELNLPFICEGGRSKLRWSPSVHFALNTSEFFIFPCM
ncbi:hypothetical protein ACEWY4_010909 [Coilia grayii]|uniref:C-type lectin domain-containing protein n=1 Tax=Coilia grayii TaxID=363190 RepID=A0ABD1K398_9TELE